MKKQIRFEDARDAYRFMLVGDDDTVFEINKGTLAFNSNEFYKTFFKGLDEKPEYEFSQTAEDLKGQAKHVFDTVAAIFKKTCDSIEASWFTAVEEPPDSNEKPCPN